MPSIRSRIKKVFVLMLENRSFDHMLGFSNLDIPATDSVKHIQKFNFLGDVYYGTNDHARYQMGVDPGHEFEDVVMQLGGISTNYKYQTGHYPICINSGFVEDYAHSPVSDQAKDNFGEIMSCYKPEKLPVLNALGENFTVCRRWFSSLPGPTWPNRFFALAATSGGLDASPSTGDLAAAYTGGSYEFKNGTIFDALKRAGKHWLVYSASDWPVAGGVHGVHFWDSKQYDAFFHDIADPNYKYDFTFIEPAYGDIVTGSYHDGTSQHPKDDVRNGEWMIKNTYEAIRNSPHWDESLLILTWDEHGGFYDHVSPPTAVPPGDTTPHHGYNVNGFDFTLYGVRVPAVVISPYAVKGLVTPTVFDHASIPKTVEELFGIPPLTNRDAHANSVLDLLTLTSPRHDAPTRLPSPNSSEPPVVTPPSPSRRATPSYKYAPSVIPEDQAELTVDKGNLPGFLLVARKFELELSPAQQHDEIHATFGKIKNRRDANEYLKRVHGKIAKARAERAQDGGSSQAEDQTNGTSRDERRRRR